MKKLYFLWLCFLPALTANAQVINIPADYPTIQQGINAASDGFTVLVSPGTYLENIDFKGKDITVASLFLTTQDSSYISQTIIDGNHAGSVVTFKTYESSAAQLCGFTITNGRANQGGGIYCYSASPNLNNLVITTNIAYGYSTGIHLTYHPGYGGGIYCDYGSPLLLHCVIKNNSADDYGGGIYYRIANPLINSTFIKNNTADNGAGMCLDEEVNATLTAVTVSYNIAGSYGGGIYARYNSGVQFDSIYRCNIYCNEADEGNDLISTGYYIEVIADTFTVLNPSIYHASPLENFTFDILNGKLQQVDADLYVSPAGNNENDGLSPQSPLKTIHHAFSFMLADSLHQNTIHLLEGTYSDSLNGERFPVMLPDYISLAGADPASVILDNEGFVGYVISMVGNQWNHVSNMTIKGGFGWVAAGPPGGSEAGGGIYCYQSSPLLENLSITASHPYPGGSMRFVGSNPVIKEVNIYDNNSEQGYGGGVLCENSVVRIINSSLSGNSASLGGGVYSENSHLNLENVTFSNNNGMSGGGIYCEGSTLCAENTHIAENSTYYYGGGVYCAGSSVILKDALITENSSLHNLYGYGGGIYCQTSELTLTNATLSDNKGNIGGGIYAIGSNTITVTNSILWDDDPQEICYTPQGGWPYGAKELTVKHSDLKGGSQALVLNDLVTLHWLEGNIDVNPQFAGGTVDPYSLFWLSPCLDTGTPDTTGLNLPPGDISGNLRVWDGNWDGTAVIDMGAYEYGSVPVGIEAPKFTGREPGSGLYCFPVPAATFITVETPGSDNPGLVTISDLNGKLFIEQPVKQPETLIDISELPSGVYVVQLKSSLSVAACKLIKL